MRNGIVVLPGYLETEATANIREELAPLLFRLRDGKAVEGARTTSYPEYACFHLDGVEHHAPSSRVFTEDPMILSVASAYGGGRGVPFNTRAELRSGPRKNELVDDLHADTWMFRFKAMLYLTDVTEDTAPFRYLAGSHRDELWKIKVHVRLPGNGLPRFAVGGAVSGPAGSAKIRRPSVRKGALHRYPGTLILFDARGIHSGTTLRSGNRMVLNRSFVLQEATVTARG
jgi:hypothetical protein